MKPPEIEPYEPPEEGEAVDEEAARDMVMRAHGATASAWLVKRFKKSIHRSGAFDVRVNEGVEIKPWFAYAIRFLQQRPGWLVMVQHHRGRRTFRVRWARWSMYTPSKIPDVLRPSP